MNCSDFIQGFSEYYDGGGSDSFVVDARRHVDGCGECRRYVAVFERGRELLRSFPEVEVSDDFHDRLRHRIYHVDEVEAPGSGSRSGTTAATTVGMAMLVVAAAWVPALLSQRPEVELAPIVVTRPAQRPASMRIPRASLTPLSAPRPLQTGRADLWGQSNALLFRYSPLNDRTREPAVRRTGLD